MTLQVNIPANQMMINRTEELQHVEDEDAV